MSETEVEPFIQHVDSYLDEYGILVYIDRHDNDLEHENSKQNTLGFLSFTILPNHVSDGRLEKTIRLLATFRNYLHYHIKASKSHLHSRMRSRVSALLKVLNDAKPKHKTIKEKKTMKGKTFNRR